MAEDAVWPPLAQGKPSPSATEGIRADHEPDTPHLPASFFSKLVRQPSCQTKGVCDNCGRCEH